MFRKGNFGEMFTVSCNFFVNLIWFSTFFKKKKDRKERERDEMMNKKEEKSRKFEVVSE